MHEVAVRMPWVGDTLRWLGFAALMTVGGLLHQAGLVGLFGWVPRPYDERLVPILLIALVATQGLLLRASPGRRPALLLVASVACHAMVSPAFTLFGLGWSLAYRRVLWSGVRPRWSLLFLVGSLLALLLVADAHHFPGLTASHPWLWVVSYLFALGWFLRALVVWQEVRTGLVRPSRVDFAAYFMFAPFALVPPYMLALPRLALVTDGVRKQDPAVRMSGLRWLAYGLALQLAFHLFQRADLDVLFHLTVALRERELWLAVPLAVLYYPFWIVLHACAAGALLVGLVRSFGVAMGPAFRAPLLSRGVADWWRRYNTHFRDLLVDLFWHRIALRYRRRPVLAAYLGCGAVFLLGSVPLHWPLRWVRDGSPWSLPWNVMVECAVMTVLVGTGLVLERRRAGSRPAASASLRAWSHRALTWLVLCATVLGLGYGLQYRLAYAPFERASARADIATSAEEARAVLPQLRRAVAEQPRNPTRRATLALMELRAGDRAAACEHLRRAHAFAVHVTAHDLLRLARAQHALGEGGCPP